MAPERVLFVGLSVIVCRIVQPLGRFLWRACAAQGSSGNSIYVGCNGSAKDRVTRGSRLLRSHDNDCPACQRANFLLC